MYLALENENNLNRTITRVSKRCEFGYGNHQVSKIFTFARKSSVTNYEKDVDLREVDRVNRNFVELNHLILEVYCCGHNIHT